MLQLYDCHIPSIPGTNSLHAIDPLYRFWITDLDLPDWGTRRWSGDYQGNRYPVRSAAESLEQDRQSPIEVGLGRGDAGAQWRFAIGHAGRLIIARRHHACAGRAPI